MVDVVYYYVQFFPVNLYIFYCIISIFGKDYILLLIRSNVNDTIRIGVEWRRTFHDFSFRRTQSKDHGVKNNM